MGNTLDLMIIRGRNLFLEVLQVEKSKIKASEELVFVGFSGAGCWHHLVVILVGDLCFCTLLQQTNLSFTSEGHFLFHVCLLYKCPWRDGLGPKHLMFVLIKCAVKWGTNGVLSTTFVKYQRVDVLLHVCLGNSGWCSLIMFATWLLK